MNDTLFVEFEIKLNSLRDFPDRDAIMRITKFAEDNVNVASHIVNIMAAKVIDPATNITYKLPIFYCMDSIMKNVGGPYAALFSRHLAEVFARAYDEVSIKDKEKLAKMLQFWEERAILPKDVMMKMRVHVNLRISTAVAAARSSVPVIAAVLIPAIAPFEQPVTVPMQVQMIQPEQQPVVTTAPIIYQVQPQVMQAAATATPVRIVADTRIIPQQQQQQQQPFRRQDQVTSTRFAPATTTTDRDRRNIPATSSSTVSRGTMRSSSTSSSTNQRQSPIQQVGRGGVSGIQRVSNRQQQQQVQHQSYQQQQQQSQRPQQHQQYQQQPMTMLESNSNVVKMENTSHLINAFICEKPVLLNLNFARDVLNQLVNFNMTTTNNNTFINTQRLNESLQQQQQSQNQLPISQFDTITSRLNNLIENVNVRPQLPSILFGPLPLEPSRHFIEQMQQQNKIIEQESMVANKKQKVILPVPKFRLEDLTKKPVRAVNLLYSDRPHQYAQDGVRFKTLQDLAAYTDMSLSKKEMNKKKEISGEKNYRAWYSTASQWIHEKTKGIVSSAAAIVVGNSKSSNSINAEISGGGGRSSASSSSSNNNKTTATATSDNNETYILPADDQFPRCVICKEPFETTWDKDEGELYYNNAVRLLVTQKADADLFQQSADTAHEMVHYCIVHKDGCSMEEFLEQGRADTLRKTKLRYKNMPFVVDMFVTAAGPDEDEDDIFCMLEHTLITFNSITSITSPINK